MKTRFNLIPGGLLLLLLAGLPPLRVLGDSLTNVQHVVILMQENRSFDHYFGTLKGVRGFNDPNILILQNGSSDLFQPTYGTNFVLPILVTNSCITDVDHGEEGGLEAWDDGWWDLWYPAKGWGQTMAYYNSTNLPFYHALADVSTICDNNFCPFNGPTFPNRLYLFSGMVDPGGTGGGPILGNTIPTNGLTWTTYPERLQAAGVSWRVYRPGGDWFGDALQWFAPYMQARPGNPLYDRGMATVNNVVSALAADVTNGTLPQVSWIIPPNLGWSEHPPYNINQGELFVSQVLAALAANPAVFKSTVFILTYDENGGFFDHVPPPVAPPGTAGEYVNADPLGPGARVPMFIVSPWTRGGRVCSQVFDHTSIIRFLETWTGVREPNISAWRRQVCGDLTSAFDFAHPDTSPLNLPAVTVGNPTNITSLNPIPPGQYLPVQEPGVRPACPLPYQPDASCAINGAGNRVAITLTNAGTAVVHLAVYPNISVPAGPWQYDVQPGGFAGDSFAFPTITKGMYDLTCYGPNGFQRRFAGNINTYSKQINVTSLIDTTNGITLGLSNGSTALVNFTITDNLNAGAVLTFALPPASSTNSAFSVLANNHGWYDLTVTADADASFLRHLAGHVENGSFSVTEAPLIVGNPLQISTNPPPPIVITVATNSVTTQPITVTLPAPEAPPGPVIASINDMVNYIIAQNSLATAATNTLQLKIGSYGGNCALIYPAWASNYVFQTTTSISPPVWTQLNATLNVVSNCCVIILPETNASQFFRMGH